MARCITSGGGRRNSLSILETIDVLADMGLKLYYTYQEQHRIGDHICYISDLSKIRSHYPGWDITKSLPTICEEIVESEEKKAASASV